MPSSYVFLSLFIQIRRHKKWQAVCDEMGFDKSLLPKVKRFYAKYLLPYEGLVSNSPGTCHQSFAHSLSAIHALHRCVSSCCDAPRA